MRRTLMYVFAALSTCSGISSARAATCYAITEAKQVLTFQTGNPGAIENNVAVTGVGSTESVLGMDLRPADGKIYLLTRDPASNAKLYTLNPVSGAATFVTGVSQTLSGSYHGVDFDPLADRLRVVASDLTNLRIHPTTGAVTTDTSIGYAAGDPNAGTFPSVFSSAFSNNYDGASQTTLYGIDVGPDVLVRQEPAAGGILHTVGALGIDIGGNTAFDIAPSPANHAFAALPTGLMQNTLFMIDLANGHASSLGIIGFPAFLDGFTVGPNYPHTSYRRQQDIHIVSSGGGYQELSYNYATGQITISPYRNTSGAVTRDFPLLEWVGIFHYDYGSAQFTQAVYSRHHLL